MNRIEVIKYKCCGKIFAACREPHCHTEKDWLLKKREYVLSGDTAEMVEGNVQFGNCECKQKQAPDLFSEL
jgi:hypothetical protein